jgi:hypothetical protein
MKYKVKRAFLIAGVRQEAGSEIELTDRDLIGGLKSFDKIEAIDAEEKPGPMTTKSSGGLIAGIKAKD